MSLAIQQEKQYPHEGLDRRCMDLSVVCWPKFEAWSPSCASSLPSSTRLDSLAQADIRTAGLHKAI